jgi:hypothetical protein
LGETFGELDGGEVGVTAGAEGEFAQLAGDGLDDVGMAEADLVHVIAVEIEDVSALGVLEGSALATTEDIQTGSRERLVNEPARVFLERAAGGVVQVGFRPTGAVGRDVEIALGLEGRVRRGEVDIGFIGRWEGRVTRGRGGMGVATSGGGLAVARPSGKWVAYGFTRAARRF